MRKKRTYFLLLGMLLALVCGVVGLAACGGEHVHTWGEWSTETASTCTAEGVERRVCTDCGEAETRPTGKIEHTFDEAKWEQVTPASCTAEGSEKNKCTVCGTESVRAVPMLEHTYSSGWVVTESATCEKEGVEQNVCDVCGQGQTRSIGKLSHSFGDWYEIESPTCTAKGVQRRNCILCNPLGENDKEGNFETAAVDELPHTPQAVEEEAPNCILPGHEAGSKCAVCGATLDGMDVIPALGHALGEPVEVSPSTCTTPGTQKQTCTHPGCEHSVETSLPLKPHTKVAIGEARAATCYSDGITAGQQCAECKKVFEQQETIPALTHILGYRFEAAGDEKTEQAGTHVKYCTRPECGYEEEEPCSLGSVITPATCTAAEHHVHTCAYCEHSYEHDEGDPLGHNYGGWFFDVEAYDASLRDRDGAETVVRQHKRVCTNPGHTEDPEDPDTVACVGEVDGEPVQATCIKAGYTNYRCPTCEATYTADKVNALGHEWEKNEDGSVKYTHETYQGMEVHYRTCTRENCDRPDGKDIYYACYYTSSTREKATCTKGATIVRVCDYCKYRAEEETGAALGHAYGAWTHDDDTSGDTSRHYRICGRAECGYRDEADCAMQSSNLVPTCQRPGKEIEVCKDCKYTEEGGEIAKLQHNVDGQPYIAERSLKSHYRVCKRCSERVYEECPYTLSTVPMTCTADEKTTYTCPDCHDSYTAVTAKSKGHEVTNYTESDLVSHKGQCNLCEEVVSVPHDFSDSNICKICNEDGLYYSYVGGSNGPKTQATVSRAFIPGTQNIFRINAARIVIPAEVDIDGNGAVPVVAVGTDAFFNNPYIEEVVLPKSIEKIDYHAFSGCTNLARVSIEGHSVGEADIADCALNRIEDGAFENCTSLTNAILPKSLQYIGRNAFRGCALLSEINIPEKVTEIEDHAFTDTAYFKDPAHWVGGVLYIGPHLIRAEESLGGSYIVRDGTVSISAEAFMNCGQLTHITLPAELKAIDRDAFSGCTSLDTVVFKGTFADYLAIRFDNDAASPMHFASTLTISGAVGAPSIPEGTTVIPAGAFRGSAIDSIVIPASVTSIGANAFADCENLTSITFERDSKLLSIGADVVKNTPFYNEAGNWTDGVLYLKDAENTPVALVAVDKERVTAAYVPYDGENFEGSAKQVEISEGTRVVAPRAFKDFTELRYVVVPGTVVYFGEGVFEGCTGLNRVNFRGSGLAWFCYASNLGRVHNDSYVYGGEDGTAYDIHRRAANMFRTYPLQWKRGNYGSGS